YAADPLSGSAYEPERSFQDCSGDVAGRVEGVLAGGGGDHPARPRPVGAFSTARPRASTTNPDQDTNGSRSPTKATPNSAATAGSARLRVVAVEAEVCRRPFPNSQ